MALEKGQCLLLAPCRRGNCHATGPKMSWQRCLGHRKRAPQVRVMLQTHTRKQAHTHMHAHTLACIHTHTHGICALVGAYAFAGVQPYAYTSRFQDERVCLHTTPAHLHTGFLANPNEFTSVTDAISIVQVPWERRLQVREKDCKLGVQIDVQETLQM